MMAPIIFLAYVNDKNDDIGTESFINMFPDDANIQRKIITIHERSL